MGIWSRDMSIGRLVKCKRPELECLEGNQELLKCFYQ